MPAVTIAVLFAVGLCLVALRAGAQARRADRGLRAHQLLADGFPGAMLVFDRRLRHTAAFGRDVATMGVDPVGRTLHEMLPAEACAVFEPAYRAAFDGRESQIELPLAGRDWVMTIAPLEGGMGLLVATDVTERKRRERRLTDLASRDTLTGSWNRRRLAEELEWLARGGGAGSLLLLDLNGFKGVNDTLGHDAGDELLRRVAHAVQGCVRRADVVARLGGDEFAVLLAGATPAEADRVAEKIRGAVAAVWPLGVRGGVSIGISAAGLGAGEALARADRAMYAEKHRTSTRLAS